MARRFGGKFSPEGAGSHPRAAAVNPQRIKAAGSRGRLLYIPAIVLVLTSLGAGPGVLVTALAGAGILTLAAWLLQDGLRAEAAYDARQVARRPALPRKMLASALTGLGVAIAALTGDSDLTGAALYGLAALALHVAAFGIDPLRDKNHAGLDRFQQDRVARVVDEAEAHLTQMAAAIASLNDRALIAQVAGFQQIARRMIATVEADPRDLSAARRFLGIYLMGARDATVKFVEITRRGPDEAARRKYQALLSDLAQNFAARTEKMLVDDHADMDIEINVLRDRLQREGVSLKTKGNE
ncbi:5-bromo-4-chloroindolyl phosphate hydrolysis family protein [Yoonia vestfoldensis]|uniref:5-bromo-4-chloroindolyl phosphate hydrolysis protein n=1 Tax=Yoonia vestfoldensis TaxID=245188 RepID=A0A1Y0ECZ6_9RHOB|nr:5-bromo-4-chloroindolyl phosphate hydrolysis family protein [Yoonia vestfoldensis]ARU01475.1 5-bromo-4-chloroindolyl phosphate hydrolysis protein [Yoonia vestfoldensis]